MRAVAHRYDARLCMGAVPAWPPLRTLSKGWAGAVAGVLRHSRSNSDGHEIPCATSCIQPHRIASDQWYEAK